MSAETDDSVGSIAHDCCFLLSLASQALSVYSLSLSNLVDLKEEFQFLPLLLQLCLATQCCQKSPGCLKAFRYKCFDFFSLIFNAFPLIKGFLWIFLEFSYQFFFFIFKIFQLINVVKKVRPEILN